MSIITVENLSKRYVIGHDKGAQGMFKYKSLRDTMAHWSRGMYQRLRHPLSPNQEITALEDFWALKDISFEINQGDRVGIIGSNGAGKSTLLKILSRITEPTSGKIHLGGRIASLLEVGTGFHPELSGRENIYLNGAILGMTKAEIKRKFDEIVDFSGVEKFLDTSVKFYSSGMYVRLAFAVAAHLEPEILVVDEVLAVGDAQFQKKCLGKMEAVAKEGRTVLFVSHNMAAIQRLCTKSIVLKEGRIGFQGEVDAAEKYYLMAGSSQAQRFWPDISNAPGNKVVRLRAVKFVDENGNVSPQADVRASISLIIDFHVLECAQLSISVLFLKDNDVHVMSSMDNYIKGIWGNQEEYSLGLYRSSCNIPTDFLNEGRLSAVIWIYSPPIAPNEAPHVKLSDAANITIIDSRDFDGARGHYPYEWGHTTAVRPVLKWKTERIDAVSSHFEI